MKHLTIESFVNSLTEEELWKIIDECEGYISTDGEPETPFLRSKARDFCSNLSIPARYHTDYMPKISTFAYRYFAMKYKENYGLNKSYKVICDETNNTPEDAENGVVNVDILYYPEIIRGGLTDD